MHYHIPFHLPRTGGHEGASAFHFDDTRAAHGDWRHMRCVTEHRDVNASALGVIAAVSVAVAIAGGLYPALYLSPFPPADVLKEIAAKVDMQKLEDTLMGEGIAKFADPQKALLKLIGQKRASLAPAK